MSTATVGVPPPRDKPGRRKRLDTTDRLVLRWLLLIVLTVLAFRHTLVSLAQATRGDTLIGYVWVVLVAGLLAAVGVALQERRDRPIHDRQTDIIVGSMCLVLALLMQGVLLRRYSIYFDLLRLDLVAMWMFLLGATIVLFGIRPLIRFVWVWLLLTAMFPLPYQIVVIVFLGGGRVAAGLGTLVIAAFAAWICAGHDRRRGLPAAAVAVLVGVIALTVLTVAFPSASLFVYQLVPALTAIVITGTGSFLLMRHSRQLPAFQRRSEPLAARQVWAAVPVVTAVAVLLSFVPLPVVATPPILTVESMHLGTPLVVPPGWHQTDLHRSPQVAAKLYGADAAMLRQEVIADDGNPRWDKLSQPRTVMVDTITGDKPYTFHVYPSLVVYAAPHARLSAARDVDLGLGVHAQLFSATDDKLLVTWNLLQWTWQNGSFAQRVLVVSVDNHDADAPFPQAGHSLPTVLNSLMVVLFRGNSAVQNLEPEFKDADMLTEFGRAVVHSQLQASGRPE